MTVAVVIPSKTDANLAACTKAVRQYEPDVMILVVDDFDGPTRFLPPAFEPVEFVKGQRPFVFARNINIGIQEAGECDGYVLLNDDALLESTSGFTLLAQEAEAHPEFGIIGATTNVTGQPLQYRRNVGLREVPHIAFVCVYIPRRTIERIGMLDERYSIDYGCEDRDYCEAVRRAGLKVGVHDGCYVDHGSLRSSFRGDPKQPKSFAENYKLFQEKCRYCDRTGEPFVAGAGLSVHV